MNTCSPVCWHVAFAGQRIFRIPRDTGAQPPGSVPAPSRPSRALTARGPSASEAAHGADAIQLEPEAALAQALLVQALVAAARRVLQQPRPARPRPRLGPRLPRLPRARAAAAAAPLLLPLFLPLRRLGRTRCRRCCCRRRPAGGLWGGEGQSAAVPSDPHQCWGPPVRDAQRGRCIPLAMQTRDWVCARQCSPSPRGCAQGVLSPP